MNINKLIDRENRISSDIKLTKAGEKWATETDKDKVIKKANFTKAGDVNLNEFIGLTLNPLLTQNDIMSIFKLIKANAEIERDDNSVKPAIKTRNSGSRGIIRKHLSIHPNIDTDTMKKLIVANRMGKPRVLQNPSITPDILEYFFENKVMRVNNGNYNFIAFGALMESKNLSQKQVLEWYNKLKKFADWSYKDNNWYSIIGSLVEYEDCPAEVLLDVSKAPKGDEFSHVERHRKLAYKHKNTTPDVQSNAYDVTGNEDYLPQEAKDLFLF